MTLPDTYEAWRHCITVGCGIALTGPYIEARLTALRDRSTPETERFADLYGEAHLKRVIGWFEQARRERAGASDG